MSIGKEIHIIQFNLITLFNAEAVKILYNRSRIVCILEKFENGVKSSLFPALPDIHEINFKLLKQEELELVNKYINGFFTLMEKIDLNNGISKIIPKIWRFILLMSKDYSVYYNLVRTLCVSII